MFCYVLYYVTKYTPLLIYSENNKERFDEHVGVPKCSSELVLHIVVILKHKLATFIVCFDQYLVP